VLPWGASLAFVMPWGACCAFPALLKSKPFATCVWIGLILAGGRDFLGLLVAGGRDLTIFGLLQSLLENLPQATPVRVGGRFRCCPCFMPCFRASGGGQPIANRSGRTT